MKILNGRLLIEIDTGTIFFPSFALVFYSVVTEKVHLVIVNNIFFLLIHAVGHCLKFPSSFMNFLQI